MTLPINQIICADCLEVLKDFPDKSVDLVLTDPPYGINRDSLHEKNKGRWGFKQYGETNWDKPIDQKAVDEIVRISLNQVIWGANYFPQFLTPSMGWIFWYKMQPNFSFSDGEFAYTSFQQKARIFEYGRGNESGFAPCGGDAVNKHPTQKPLALGMWILERYSKPDDLILDCYCGSGTFCVAAKLLGRRYIGIEISPDYCKIAEERLRAIDSAVPVKEARKGQLSLLEGI